MAEKTEKTGLKEFKVSRSIKANTEALPEISYNGKIKSIVLPLSIRTAHHKKYKKRELHLCFSALKPNEDKSAEIKKDLNFLYKNGTYAPGTHLIPMSVTESAPVDDLFRNLYGKFSMPCGPLPGTATRCERIDFFPCHNDVLDMMIKHFEYPDFYVSLLPTSATLNIKIKSPQMHTYQSIPLKHTSGKCCNGHGYSYIHVYGDNKNHGVLRYQQIKWDTFEFEEDESNSPYVDCDFVRYIDFK